MKRVLGNIGAGVLLTAFTLALHAATAQGQAAAYLKLGIDSRILGMGGAGTAVSRDVNSGYWNPAGLASLDQKEAAGMHTSLSLDRNYNYFAYASPWTTRDSRKWTFGLAYHRFSVDGIPETRVWNGTNDPILTGECATGTCIKGSSPSPATDSVKIFSFFEDSETALFLSAATRLSDKLTLGGSFKFLNQSLFDQKADGTGFDLGLQYQYNGRTRFGLTVRDFAESLEWTTDSGRKDDIPVTVTAGAALELKSEILLAVDVLKREHERIAFRFGAERWFFDRYGLRVGNNEGEFTVGASAKLDDWNFDFSYNDQDLGSVQRISLKRKF